METERRRVPRNYWNQATIEKEALSFYELNGDLSQGLLTKSGQNGLGVAIGRKYPGGMLRLKTTLGVDHSQKPKGYWTKEKIEQEAQEFYRTSGALTAAALLASGRSDLQLAISRSYPGKLRGIKDSLGIPSRHRPRGFWTSEIMEQAALIFFEDGGRLTHYELAQQRKPALSHAIATKYPGGIQALREKLGIGHTFDQYAPSTDQANEQLEKLTEVSK